MQRSLHANVRHRMATDNESKLSFPGSHGNGSPKEEVPIAWIRDATRAQASGEELGNLQGPRPILALELPVVFVHLLSPTEVFFIQRTVPLRCIESDMYTCCRHVGPASIKETFLSRIGLIPLLATRHTP